MYYAYTIKLFFTDGDWTYVRWAGNGKYDCTKDPGNTIYFDTYDEAKQFYYSKVKNFVHSGGKTVDWSQSIITQIQSSMPL